MSICEGESYTGETISCGQAYPSGQVLRCGMTPRSGNTFINKTANGFSFLMKRQGTNTLEIGARIYDDAGVLQATSTNTINDVDTASFNFREFEFGSAFTITEGYFYVIYQVSGTFNDTHKITIQMNATPSDNNSLGYYSDTWYDSYFGTYKPVSICFRLTSGGTSVSPPPIAWVNL